MTALWMFYFFYLFNALGYVCGGPLPNQVLLSRWFERLAARRWDSLTRDRMGGSLVLKLAPRWLNGNSDGKGAAWLGLLMIVVALPLVYFVQGQARKTDAGRQGGSRR